MMAGTPNPFGGMRATRRKDPTELSEDTVQSAVDGMETFAAAVTASIKQNRCVCGDVSPRPSPISADPGQVGWGRGQTGLNLRFASLRPRVCRPRRPPCPPPTTTSRNRPTRPAIFWMMGRFTYIGILRDDREQIGMLESENAALEERVRELEEKLKQKDGSSEREEILELKITALETGMDKMEQFAEAGTEATEEQKRKALEAITNTKIILEILDGIAASQNQPAAPQTANAGVSEGFVSDSDRISEIASELLSATGGVGGQIVVGMRTQPPFERKSGFVERKWYTLDQLLEREEPKTVPMKDWLRGRKQAIRDLLEKNDGCDVFRFSKVGDEEAPLGITPKGSLPDSGFEEANKWMQTVWTTIVSAHSDGVFEWAVDTGDITIDGLIKTLNDKATLGQTHLCEFVINLHREMPKPYVPRPADGKAADPDDVSSIEEESDESESEYSEEYDGSKVGLMDAPSEGRLAVYEDDYGLRFCLVYKNKNGEARLDPEQWADGSYGTTTADKHGKRSRTHLYGCLGYSRSEGLKMRDLYDIFRTFAHLSSTPLDELTHGSQSILALYVTNRMDGPETFNTLMKSATYNQIIDFFEKVSESHAAQLAGRAAKLVSMKRAAATTPNAEKKKMRAE